MSSRSDSDYVADMLEASGRILCYCDGKSYDEFLADTKTQDAVVRNLEILGEAVKSLSDTSKQKIVFVPWNSISGMRDRLIHNYFGVNWDIVWEVVNNDLPKLVDNLKSISTDLG